MRQLLFLCLLAIAGNALAQPTLTIGTNTRVAGTGAAQLVYGGGSLTNNGSLSLAAGQLSATGPTTYGGSGAATVANVSFGHSTGSSTLNSLLSVTNRATLSANTTLNANGQLYLRTDQFPNADLVNDGILTGTVQGLVTRGTVLTGNTPYNSVLSHNVSGTSARYQWQSSTDNSAWADITGATSPTYTASVSATTYYRCRLTTSNSNYNQTTPALLLNFTGAPQVTLSSLAGSPNPVCAGGVLSVTAAVGNTTGSYAYTLTTGSNPMSGTVSGATFSQTLTASGSGNQTLSLTISANDQLVTASTSLTVNELPTPGLTANFAGVLTCAQTSLTLTATGGVSYTFANATGNLGTPGPTNTLVVSNAGTYFVQVANASGCTSQTSITVSSNQTAPTLSVSPSSATLTMANPTVNLTASGAGSFRWSTGETSPSISVTASGTYSVTLTSPGGCTASASVPVVGADLTVTLELPQANFAATGSVGNLVVNVFEVGGLPTSSGNVTITITAPVGYTIAFAPSQTSIQVTGGSTVAVDNGQWTVTNSLEARQLSLTMNSGAFISGRGESRLGFSITRTNATSGSTANITVNVADDLTRTYDGNLSNNGYARVIGGL